MMTYQEAMGQMGKKRIRNGIWSSGKKTGNGTGRLCHNRGHAVFQISCVGIGNITSAPYNFPDTILYFFACNIGIPLIDNAGDG